MAEAGGKRLALEAVLKGTGRLALFGTIILLSACDSKPNKDFEQVMKDQQAASAGDRFASLESSMPRQSNYIRQKKELQRDYAAGQSGTFRATYDSLLPLLKKDKKVDTSSPLFKVCHSAFEEASAYQSDSGDAAAAVAPLRDKALASLKLCRDSAQKAKHAGGDKAYMGGLLSRFASTGVAMIGAKVVGQGDSADGLKIWREGEGLVAKDKPGFQISAKSFRGY